MGVPFPTPDSPHRLYARLAGGKSHEAYPTALNRSAKEMAKRDADEQRLTGVISQVSLQTTFRTR